ncbi:unnamed protein product [Effrenium voratum]|nr:unnamed protein product [Effrenium voratum]
MFTCLVEMAVPCSLTRDAHQQAAFLMPLEFSKAEQRPERSDACNQHCPEDLSPPSSSRTLRVKYPHTSMDPRTSTLSVPSVPLEASCRASSVWPPASAATKRRSLARSWSRLSSDLRG